MSDYVLVIGASLMDTKGKPTAGLEPGTSNPAAIRTTVGGTARNVAENLARLGAEVILLTAVGDDDAGQMLLKKSADAGVDLSHARRIAGGRTGSYIAVLDEGGHLSVALDDTSVMTYIDGPMLRERESLFENAHTVVIDGSLSEETLQTAVELAEKYKVPICADPSSTRLAPKLKPYIGRLSLVVPNELEASTLCECDYPGFDPAASLMLARRLVHMGVETAVVTLSDYSLVYATSEESGHIPAHYSFMVDSTGTGDAITAAILFGQLNQLPAIECMRLGAAAAGLTLQSADSVVEELSLDLLYEHLIV